MTCSFLNATFNKTDEHTYLFLLMISVIQSGRLLPSAVIQAYDLGLGKTLLAPAPSYSTEGISFGSK